MLVGFQRDELFMSTSRLDMFMGHPRHDLQVWNTHTHARVHARTYSHSPGSRKILTNPKSDSLTSHDMG